MNPLLLASNRPPLNEGDAPRQDFVELARALGGTLSFPPEKSGLWGKLESATASDFRQARAARSQPNVCVFLSLSEKVGLPLALMGAGGTRHILIGHHLTSGKKVALQKRTGWLNRLDAVIVLCREQENYLLKTARIPREKVFFVPDKVDHHFFRPLPKVTVEPDLIVAVGRERRDYRTLVDTMKSLPEKRAIIVASSPWARTQTSESAAEVPGNVTFTRGLSFCALRELYARASVVCVPIEKGTRYAAGINGMLEGMAMGRPLVVTRTPGLDGYLDPAAVVSVQAGDCTKLADALAQTPDPAHGIAGRMLVESGWNLEAYIEAVKGIVLP